MSRKIGLIYGSNEGHTTAVCEQMKGMYDIIAPNIVELVDIGTVKDKSQIEKYDYLIWSCPTWNIGELQDDWAAYFPEMDNLDLSGKKLALFGLGDQFGYSSSFVDAIGILGKKAEEKGATIVGHYPRDEYQFEGSAGLMPDGKMLMGLAIDDDNEAEKTEARLVEWIVNYVEPAFLEMDGADKL